MLGGLGSALPPLASGVGGHMYLGDPRSGSLLPPGYLSDGYGSGSGYYPAAPDAAVPSVYAQPQHAMPDAALLVGGPAHIPPSHAAPLIVGGGAHAPVGLTGDVSTILDRVCGYVDRARAAEATNMYAVASGCYRSAASGMMDMVEAAAPG
jgi:hypothetical protein